MSIIAIESFGGISPLVDNRKLPVGGAQRASDVVLDGGDLRAMLEPAIAPGISYADLSEVTSGDVVKLVPFRSPTGVMTLLRFRGPRVYDVVPVPVTGDVWSRVYWTDSVNPSMQYAAQFSPSTRRTVGVLPPTTVPVLADAKPNSSVSITAITLSSTPEITTSAPHGFKDGQVVAITVSRGSVPDADPIGMTELSGKQFIVTKATSTTFQILGIDTSSLSALKAGQVASAIRVLRSEDIEDRVYVYTLVSEYGEESQPSPPSQPIQIPLDGGVCRVTFNPPQQGGATRSTVTKIRIYRSITGQAAGTAFYFVDEIPYASDVAYVDEKRSIALGELLPSESWSPPPQKLRGIRQMPGGYMIGYVGNTLHACEPNLPHAWPDDYRRSIPSAITAIESFGGMFVVLTEGEPYIGYGNDPAALTLQKMDRFAPCLKPRCVVSTGGAVIYPSYDGLIMVSQSGVQNLTEQRFTRQQWASILQWADCAAWHDGRYYLFDDAASSAEHTMIFDVEGGTQITTTSTAGVSAAVPDPVTDLLLFCRSGDASGVASWMEVSVPARESVWTSKLFTSPRPFSPSVVQVLSDFSSPSGSIVVDVIPGAFGFPYSEEVLNPNLGYASVTINSNEPQRLPAMAMSRDWTIRLRFTGDVGRINGVTIAQSMDMIGGGA